MNSDLVYTVVEEHSEFWGAEQCSDGLVLLYCVLSYLLLMLLSDACASWTFLCDPVAQTNEEMGIKLLRHLKRVNHHHVIVALSWRVHYRCSSFCDFFTLMPLDYSWTYRTVWKTVGIDCPNSNLNKICNLNSSEAIAAIVWCELT